MSAVLIELANEVVTALNAGAFGFTATRVYTETRRLEDLDALKVEVVPQATTRERAARKVWTRKGTVLVGFQARLAEDRQASIDEYMQLADQVCAYLETYAFSTGGLEEIEELVSWDRSRYDQHGVFTRPVLLTFQLGSFSQ